MCLTFTLHIPFRVQTKLNHIILYTLSPSLFAPTRTSHPAIPHFYRLTPNHFHSYLPHAQTASVWWHQSTMPHYLSHALNTQKTVQDPTASYPSETPHIHLTIIRSALPTLSILSLHCMFVILFVSVCLYY